MTRSTIHSSHKLQAWFDALTGEPRERTAARSNPSPSDTGHDELVRIASEGALIRRALVQRGMQVSGPIAASLHSSHQRHREVTLLRARQAGLFSSRKRRMPELVNSLISLLGSSRQKHTSIGSEGLSQVLIFTRVGVVVAGGAILIALYLLSRPVAEPVGYPGGVVMRGDEQARRLAVEKPSALADQIEAVLREESVLLRRTVAGQAIEIQARITTISNGGRSRLLALGVVVPAHGRLHIVLIQQ